MANKYIEKGALYDALWDAKEEKKVKSLKGVFDFIDKFPVEDVQEVKWISVKDRLPENEERVLVAVDSDKSDTKIDTDRMVYRQWVRWGMSVTHWMPLPELPQAEQKLKEMRGGQNA